MTTIRLEPVPTLVRRGLWLVVALWLGLWLLRLATGDDLAVRDQERQCAYIMDAWSNGRWSAQTDYFADMASKPPLYNWIGAAAVAVLGPGYVAVTAPAALATLLLTILSWHWARRLAGPWAGLLAGILVLLPMIGQKMVAYVRTDGLFTALVALTAYAWWRHWEERRGWLWPWLAAAAATLTKGPLGLLLGSFGLIALVWERRGERTLTPADRGGRRELARWWPVGFLIYLALAAGWFLWAWSQWGQPLIDRMILRELVGHAVASRDSPGGIGSEFYKAPLYLLWRTAPWCVFTVLAVIRVVRRADADGFVRRAERFLVCWLLAGTLTFALASHQRGDLIWPLVLPSAVLAAREIVLRAPGWPRWVGTRLAPALLVLTLVLVVVVQVNDRPPKASLQSAQLAAAIAAGPGAEFPLSFDVKYTTQAHLGIQRYRADRATYVAALAGTTPVYVAVDDPRAVVSQVAAAGGTARALIETRGGYGVVANRETWVHGPSLRLLMGPLDVVVQHAEFQRMHGRRLDLAPATEGESTVVIRNSGPHREQFDLNMAGAPHSLSLVVAPATMARASWHGGAGWSVAIEPISAVPLNYMD